MASTLPALDSCCDPCVGAATVEFTGSVGIFLVEDLTALADIPASPLNQQSRVATTAGLVGDYIWVNDSVVADDGFTVIAPSDGGVGRWHKVL